MSFFIRSSRGVKIAISPLVVVNTATLSETGSSANSIKNYIEDAYYGWENPPEYVALVGDVGGSYSVPTFYEGWGHNSYGNDCEGDLQYSQLDGDDFIPEVIVGRISVRSSNEIGVVVCKRIPGRIQRRDCMFHLASDWQG